MAALPNAPQSTWRRNPGTVFFVWVLMAIVAIALFVFALAHTSRTSGPYPPGRENPHLTPP